MGFAGWYDATLVPRLIRCACGAPAIMERRAEVVPLASGRVFEIGCGGGLNQQFYDPARVTSFAGIDPGARLLDYAREALGRKGWPESSHADIREGVGEAIPFASASFDTAVCTFTLCSVADPARVLGELHRVLVPGGKLLFLEHGAAPDAGVATWQRRIEPLWKRIAGGCHLTRPIVSAIGDAGFDVTPIGARYAEKTPRWAGWMEWGVATARA